MRGAGSVAWLLTALLAVPALGHPPPRAQRREIIRLQGRRGDLPAARRMTLVALGVEHAFASTERQAFALSTDDTPATPPGDRYTLQGPRALLARFAAARPEQTVTILAEHHPGSSDLFLLALDLCPPP